MSRFANPTAPLTQPSAPVVVGWIADAERERRRGRHAAALLQMPGQMQRPPKVWR